MRGRPWRRDTEGVASTVATLFTLLVFLIFFQIVVFAPIPAQQYDAEWATSREALAAFELTRSVLAGPADVGSSFTVSIPVGTPAVSPFAGPSPGLLTFSTAQAGPKISFRYVPDFLRKEVTHVDQDVILAIDSSGSMNGNDPDDLRISSAKEYVDSLRCPDRIAVVDFDQDAHLTRRNLGTNFPRHHMDRDYHDCTPNYSEVKGDLDTIDSDGGTNFWQAMVVANDEFVSYGDYRHQWVIILLTDGLNNQQQWDDFALDESNRSADLGVILYTIGLGDEPDAQVLGQMAANTGGSYYHAQTAEEIRWIYLEIANRYDSSFICSQYSTVDGAGGTIELALGSREFPAQSFRMEGGALSLVQRTGTEMQAGLPFVYQPEDSSSGSFGLTLVSFVGTDVRTAGTGHEILRATVIGRDQVAQTVHKIDLDEEADTVDGVQDELEDWRDQGAATDVGVNAVANHTAPARNAILNAQANYTAGTITVAKAEVQRAQIFLAETMEEIDAQVDDLQIQNWLGESTKDDIRVIACRLDQWLNWYDGLKFTVDSPAAAGWARWFRDALKGAGARVSVSYVGEKAILNLHTINEYVIDHRFVEISFGIST